MHMYIISNEHKLISTLNLSKKVNCSYLGNIYKQIFYILEPKSNRIYSSNQIHHQCRFSICKQLKLFLSALIKDFTFTNISYSECRIKCFNEILAQSTTAYLLRLHDVYILILFIREKGSQYYNQIIDDKKITALRIINE